MVQPFTWTFNLNKIIYFTIYKWTNATVNNIEGTSFDDINAHFIIRRAAHILGRAASLGGAGQNRQNKWNMCY